MSKTYQYKQFDNIFDIESLGNFYLDSHYYPARHSFDVYYSSTVTKHRDLDRKSDKLPDHENLESYIRKRIFKLVPFKQIHKLDPKFVIPKFHFYNLRYLKNIERYCRLFGIAPNHFAAMNYMRKDPKTGQIQIKVSNHSTSPENVNNGFSKYGCHYVDADDYNKSLRSGSEYYDNQTGKNLVTDYYPVKKTDPIYNPNSFGQGLMFGYNSNNYDLTMIASIMSSLINDSFGRKVLNEHITNWNQIKNVNSTQLETDQEDLLSTFDPKQIRKVNDALFTKYIKNMPQYLLGPTVNSKGQKQSFFDRMNNTPWFIHKGWMQTNRFLDVSDLNEHMNMVSLKRLECILGLQVKESKNVIDAASNDLHNTPQQIGELIAYNINDVFATTIVFQQPVYQDAFSLRNSLLSKYPQLIYNWGAKNVKNRLMKNAKEAIQNDEIKLGGKIKPLKYYQIGDKANGHPIKNYHEALQANETLVPYNKVTLATNIKIASGKAQNKLTPEQRKQMTKQLAQDEQHLKDVKNAWGKQLRKHAIAEDVLIAPDNLRFTRLNSDASSQKFISHVIAPYHPMADWPFISFMYPDPRVLRQIRASTPKKKLIADHIPKHPVDVLDVTMKWAWKQDARMEKLAKKNHRHFYHYGKHRFMDTFPEPQSANVYNSLHKPLGKKQLIQFPSILKKFVKDPEQLSVTVPNGPVAHSFWNIFCFYKALEGCNTNLDMTQYHKGDAKITPSNLSYNTSLNETPDDAGKLIPVGPLVANVNKLSNLFNMNSFYINPDGTRSTCMLNFSVGGLHGAEIKLPVFKKELAHYNKVSKLQTAIRDYFIKQPTHQQGSLFASADAQPVSKRQLAHSNNGHDLAKVYSETATEAYRARKVRINGHIYNTRNFISGSGKSAHWKTRKKPSIYMVNKQTGKTKVRKKYAYISVGPCRHEDFSGYYPLLLSKIGAFWPHDQAHDEYKHIYHERLHLKAQLKKYVKNSPHWQKINQAQLLRKLLLNSASGAGGATFANNIKKNNAILSMRILGQLFAWRIGEAETLGDGLPHSKNPINRGYPRVPSTNTDGMYVMDIPPKLNDRILAKNVASMMLDISPVPLLRFVSKDANNRAEIEDHGKPGHPKAVLTEAHGSNLTSWAGPSPVNRLSHPAICDCVLTHYLAYHGNNTDGWKNSPCDMPLNLDIVTKMLKEWRAKLDPDKSNLKDEFAALQMFQWQIVSGLAKHRYPYFTHQVYDAKKKAFVPNKHWSKTSTHDWETIFHTNRIYLLKTHFDGKDNTFMKLATNRKIPAATKRKRRRQKSTSVITALNNKYGLGKYPKSELDRKVLVENQGESKAIMHAYGYDLQNNPQSPRPLEDGTINKISSMPEHQNVCIITDNLHFLPKKELKFLSKNIDISGYLKIVIHAFYHSWYNFNPLPNKEVKHINDFVNKLVHNN